MKELKGPGWTAVKYVVRTVEGLLLLIVLMGIPDFELPFLFLLTLCFGWIVFLVKMVPQIPFNWVLAGQAGMALAFAGIGLHWISRSWYRRCCDESIPWRMSWTVKIGLILLMVFPVSIATLSMVAQIRELSVGPSWVTISSKVKQVRELADLKQIAAGVKLYAEDHEGNFPKSLLELVPDYCPEGRALFSRAGEGEPPEPYVYVPGHSLKDDPKTIIAKSPRQYWRNNNGLKRCVVYLDGSAEIITEADLQGKGPR